MYHSDVGYWHWRKLRKGVGRYMGMLSLLLNFAENLKLLWKITSTYKKKKINIQKWFWNYLRQRTSNSEGESTELRITCARKGKIQTLFINNLLSFRMWIIISNALDIWCNFSPPSPLYFKRLSFQPRILSFSLILLLPFPHPQEKGFHKFKAFTDNTMTVTNPCFTTLSSLVILRTESLTSKLQSTKRSQRCPIWLPTIPSVSVQDPWQT